MSNDPHTHTVEPYFRSVEGGGGVELPTLGFWGVTGSVRRAFLDNEDMHTHSTGDGASEGTTFMSHEASTVELQRHICAGPALSGPGPKHTQMLTVAPRRRNRQPAANRRVLTNPKTRALPYRN